MKRIVICCDGTWNQPDATSDGLPCATNVVKVAKAVQKVDAGGTPQLLFYNAGIGSSGSVVRRWFDGYTGTGISGSIKQAYRFLILHYEPGDELYFFGFSRGAFTVRSLAGLVRNCGILRADSLDRLEEAYSLYLSRSTVNNPTQIAARLFRRTYAVGDVSRIRFIGVWDTVGALGNPLLARGLFSRANQFHDTDLSSIVDTAYQALALDEKRRMFKPALWHQQLHSVGQELGQRWFVGVHSNVGGGYPTTALSDIALEWMVSKARDCGLGMDPIPANGDPMHPCEESRKGFYHLLTPYYRPIWGDYPGKGPTNEDLDPSVIVRYVSDRSYQPKNLESFFARFPRVRPVKR